MTSLDDESLGARQREHSRAVGWYRSTQHTANYEMVQSGNHAILVDIKREMYSNTLYAKRKITDRKLRDLTQKT